MKKLLILALVAVGSMSARWRDRDCGSCNTCTTECATVYEGARPVCKELRLVTVPAQREVYYSCPEPSEAHVRAITGFYGAGSDDDTIIVKGNDNKIYA